MKKLLLAALFLAFLVSFGNQGWVKLYKLRQVEKRIEDENRLVEEKNRLLQEEIVQLKDVQYLETYIRGELGYIRDDEILIFP